MGPEQWLFLQWHEHKGSLVSTFEKLFERNTFVDCTLAAEGQYLNVHKMILSACSPYFEILLNENRDKHPIIILKDVKFRSLKSIIEYMYRGEANVLSTEMTDFLAAAETLQIKGIGKQGGGDTRTQPKNLRDLMEEQSRPPCPTMQIIKEEKDNWADSDLSSALTETVQDSFVTQNAVLFSQGDGGATIALPQKLPKGEAAAEEAEAAAPGLGSHTEPVRPAAPQPDWAGAASAGDAGPLEAAPKAEADADLPAPAPPPAPAPAPRPPPADMEDAETASLGSSVIELSDTTEEWAEEEDMDEGQAAHAHALAPAAEESRARFEAASDVARDSASRDLGSEQAAAAGPVLSPAPTRRASTSTSASASPSASANASARASACASAASVASAASRTSLTTHAGATTSAASAASANSATAGRRRRRSGAAPPAPLSAAGTRPRQASGLSPRKAPRVSSGAAVGAAPGAAPGAGPGATADDLQGALRRASPPKAKRSPGKGAARGKRQQRAFSDAEGCDAESAAAVAAAALGGDAIEDAFAHASSNLKSALRCLRSQCHYYSSPSLAAAAASPTPTSASTPTPPTPTPARRQARSYVCPVCSKVFPWLCHLKIHLETHRGEQVYKCEECAYSTTKFSDYLLHQRLHSWRSSHAARQRSHARAAAVASAATAASAASAVAAAAACPSARLHKCSMWEFGDGAAPVPTAHCASEGNLRLGVYRYRL